MTFTAGLRVIEWSEAIAQLLDFIEYRLIGLMSRIIDQAVGFVVKASGCVGEPRGSSNQSKGTGSRCNK